MVILCAGMFRSGSTWQYQIALELARHSGRTVHAHGMPANAAVPKIVADGVDDDAFHIVKTHVPDFAISEYLTHPGLRVLLSYRDLRDVAYSMAHKLGGTFEDAVQSWRVVENSRTNHLFYLKASHRVVQRYETWIVDQRPFIARIAAKMDIEASPELIETLRDRYCLRRQKAHADAIAAELRNRGVNLSDPRNAINFDPDSLLHWNHIREGRVGHWRDLATPEQKQTLFKLCGDWLLKHGYEDDGDWVTLA